MTTELNEVERLRATVNAVQSLHDRLAQERPYALGNAYVELLRDALRAPGGCDPWGVPCPTHGADHWRNATDRLTAERDAAVERVQRVRGVAVAVAAAGVLLVAGAVAYALSAGVVW